MLEMKPLCQFRQAGVDDVGPCGRTIYSAFKTLADRHGVVADFPSEEAAAGLVAWLLGRSTVVGLVAEDGGRLVGCIFIDLSRPVAGICVIAVDPAAQDQDLGRALMTAAIEKFAVAGLENIRFVQAAYNNKSMALYTKLGFKARASLSVLQGAAPAAVLPGRDVRPALEADIADADRLCRYVHGFTRTADLRAAIKAKTATIVSTGGRLTGYATEIGFAGHAVAEDNQSLKALIGAAPAFTGPGFLLPVGNTEVLQWCLEQKLKLVMQMTLMTSGLYSDPSSAWMPSFVG